MNVLLLNCMTEASYIRGKPTIPLGLLSIAAFLKSKGIESSIRNLAFVQDPARAVNALVAEKRPDIVGISFYTDNRARAYELSRIVRAAAPEAVIVMGGHHASCMHQQLLAGAFADVVVIGEGERTFHELVTHLSAGRPLDTVAGLAFQKDGRIVVTPKRPFIRDLDSLPPYYTSLTELDTYKHHLSPAAARAIANDALGPRPWEFTHFPLITTRGCPYNCLFCASTVLGGGDEHYWRAESASRIADTVEHLYRTRNCRFVDFWDNSFNIRPDRVVAICEEFRKRRLRIWWQCTMRANRALNPPSMLKAMKDAGCYKIHYGVESGSPEVLRNINKRISTEEIIETASAAKGLGIKLRLLFMIGNPGETADTVARSIDLARICRPQELIVNLTIVYPATGLYELAKQRGLMDDTYWLTEEEPAYYPEASYLQANRWAAALRFANHRGGGALKGMYAAKTLLREYLGVRVTSRGAAFVLRRPPLFDRVQGPPAGRYVGAGGARPKGARTISSPGGQRVAR